MNYCDWSLCCGALVLERPRSLMHARPHDNGAIMTFHTELQWLWNRPVGLVNSSIVVPAIASYMISFLIVSINQPEFNRREKNFDKNWFRTIKCSSFFLSPTLEYRCSFNWKSTNWLHDDMRLSVRGFNLFEIYSRHRSAWLSSRECNLSGLIKGDPSNFH